MPISGNQALYERIQRGDASSTELQEALSQAFQQGWAEGAGISQNPSTTSPLNFAAMLIEAHGKGAVATKTAEAVRLLPVDAKLM